MFLLLRDYLHIFHQCKHMRYRNVKLKSVWVLTYCIVFCWNTYCIFFLKYYPTLLPQCICAHSQKKLQCQLGTLKAIYRVCTGAGGKKKRLHFCFRCFQRLESAWFLDKVLQTALNHKCSTLRLNGFILDQLGCRMPRLLTDIRNVTFFRCFPFNISSLGRMLSQNIILVV